MVFVHINLANYFMARMLLHNHFVFDNHNYLLAKMFKEHILPHPPENLTIFMVNKFNYCCSFGWNCMHVLHRYIVHFLYFRFEVLRYMMVRILSPFVHFNINYSDLRVVKKLLDRWVYILPLQSHHQKDFWT